MIWILVAVILGAFIYVTVTILTYSTFIGKARPRIRLLKDRILQFEEATAKEKRLNDIVEERVKEEQMGLGNLELAIAETKQEIQAALARREKLELELFKQGKDF